LFSVKWVSSLSSILTGRCIQLVQWG
jgi:hypothetical protein